MWSIKPASFKLPDGLVALEGIFNNRLFGLPPDFFDIITENIDLNKRYQ